MDSSIERSEKFDVFDLVILYSGGADSRLMLEFAGSLNMNPFCVLIDYEQLHIKELELAQKLLDSYNIPYRIVKIHGLGVDSGLTGSFEKNDSEQVHEMYVPGRNTIFISIAFSIAENLDIDTIWIGSDWSDRLNLFPDCYQEYIVQLNEFLKYAGPKNIKV